MGGSKKRENWGDVVYGCPLTAIDKENILLALEAVPMEMEKMISIQAMKPTERKLTLKR